MARKMADFSRESRTDRAKVLDRMRRLCSAREYCSSDIRQKIGDMTDNAADAEDIMDSLIRDGYVDDRRYAGAFARDKSTIAGWGPVKIGYALSCKGIPHELIEGALKGIDDACARRRLYRLLEVKSRSVGNDPQRRMKLLRFAVGRGYGYDQAAAVIDDVINRKQ